MGRMLFYGRRLVVGMAMVAATTTLAQAGAEEGKATYEKRCKVCHSIAGVAGKKSDVGGPLDGVGTKRDEAWLRKYLTDPKSAVPEAKMPKLKYTEEQLADLVAYMLTLK
jgi:nitric oxide reductase subunit C